MPAQWLRQSVQPAVPMTALATCRLPKHTTIEYPFISTSSNAEGLNMAAQWLRQSGQPAVKFASFIFHKMIEKILVHNLDPLAAEYEPLNFLKVHKIENFFGSEFGFCFIS
jgi:hypothetical protein